MATSSLLHALNTSMLSVRLSDDGHFLLFNPNYPSAYQQWDGKPLKLEGCTFKASLHKDSDGNTYGQVNATWEHAPALNDDWVLDPETDVLIFPPAEASGEKAA